MAATQERTEPVEIPLPDVTHLVTEDDTPVDNLFSAKQQVLLTSPLDNSWEGRVPGEPFLAVANVGLYYAVREPALVPDMLLSLDVRMPEDIWQKSQRSYMVWEYGKPPDLVVEIVSNQVGGELDAKIRLYARIGVAYYVVFDPLQQVQDGLLQVYCLNSPLRRYAPCPSDRLPGIGLGLRLWEGNYAGRVDTWLRWTDGQGSLIPTGDEERERADAETKRADAESKRADREEERARRLAARLRELGADPDNDI